MKIKPNKIVLAVFLLTNGFALYAQQTVTDIDGNVYNTVTIGTQKWMVENLCTTRYNDSIAIPEVANAIAWGNLTTPGMCANNNTTNTDTISSYGRLYNWYAVNTKKLAPVGWHVPTDAEFTILENYLIANGYNYDGTTSGNKIAKSLASATGWASSSATGAVGNTDYAAKCNATGFCALPGGFRDNTGPFTSIGTDCNWWSSNMSNASHAIFYDLNYAISNMERFGGNMNCGFSVRCIEDPIPDSAKYFGETPPGDTAIVFAPEFFSNTHPLELKIAFSPDGKELYYSVYTDSFKIYFTKRVNNSWTEPAEAPFSVNHNALSPYFSADGNSLYFTSFNPTNYINTIYKVERTTGGWSEPQILPSPINIVNESDYAETPDSVAYISSNRNNGDWDIWCIRRLSYSTFQAVNLGSNVNSNGQDSYPCTAPDGSYLIFSSTRSSSYGNQDLYICFNKGNNTLTAPINMEKSGAKINIANSFQDYPSLSPDGKFLFFRRANSDFSTTNVYWVSTHIIDTLKKIAMPTGLDNNTIDQKVKLYPNPTKGYITLSLGTSQNHETLVEIYNLMGSQVLSQTLQNTSSVAIDLTGNPTGMYIVKVIADGVSYEEKILKE